MMCRFKSCFFFSFSPKWFVSPTYPTALRQLNLYRCLVHQAASPAALKIGESMEVPDGQQSKSRLQPSRRHSTRRTDLFLATHQMCWNILKRVLKQKVRSKLKVDVWTICMHVLMIFFTNMWMCVYNIHVWCFVYSVSIYGTVIA